MLGFIQVTSSSWEGKERKERLRQKENLCRWNLRASLPIASRPVCRRKEIWVLSECKAETTALDHLVCVVLRPDEALELLVELLKIQTIGSCAVLG